MVRPTCVPKKKSGREIMSLYILLNTLKYTIYTINKDIYESSEHTHTHTHTHTHMYACVTECNNYI